jgi:flotillin
VTYVIIGVVVTLLFLIGAGIWGHLHQCPPNQILVFSGGSGARGYRLVKGTLGVRRPFVERVDTVDLTNMTIELNATNAYAKGGVPVNVVGVANVKIASHEPLVHNAIERFLGKSRAEIMQVAKATLEGSLRGVLATLTPEQLNEDRSLFQERLVQEGEQDMNALGLVVDTLRIQNITDDVKYLDSIGRIRNAELLSSARVAEAIARADASVRSSENSERETEARIAAQIDITKAEGERSVQDAITRRAAVIAEEQALVAAKVARARAELDVQKARLDQVRAQLDADVIAPAKARCEAMEAQAAASVASIIEDGKARASALSQLSLAWTEAGDNAREIFLIQKIEPIIQQLTATIGQTNVQKYTVIDTGSGGGSDASRLVGVAEQIKELFGVDVVAKLQQMAPVEGTQSAPQLPSPAIETKAEEFTVPAAQVQEDFPKPFFSTPPVQR